MKPQEPKQILAFLKSRGASAQNIRDAYKRSIEGIEDCQRRAAKSGKKYNGLTAQEWGAELETYKAKVNKVLALL